MTTDEMCVVKFRYEPPVALVEMEDGQAPSRAESEFIAEYQVYIGGISNQEFAGIRLTGIDHLDPQPTIRVPCLFVTEVGDELTSLPCACEQQITQPGFTADQPGLAPYDLTAGGQDLGEGRLVQAFQPDIDLPGVGAERLDDQRVA
jgi:hypothetical protein